MQQVVSATTTTQGTRRPSFAGSLLRSLPDLLPCGLAGFSLVLAALYLTESFTPLRGLVIGSIVAVIAMVVVYPALDHMDAASIWPIVCVLVICVAFVWFNRGFIAENIYPGRDAATYVDSARWMMFHSTLHIPSQNQVFINRNVFAGTPGVGIAQDGTYYFQGAHLVPAFSAIGGYLGGNGWLLKTNLILGSVGLLGMFAALRRIMHAWWAVLATFVFAISLPMLYFTRSMFTEPITLAFLMGSIALFASGIKRGRVSAFIAAGVLLGCGEIARVDSLVPAVALVAMAGLLLIRAQDRQSRRRAAGQVAGLVGGAAVCCFLGIIDLVLYAPGYWDSLYHTVRSLLLVLAAEAVVVAIAVAISWWRPSIVRWAISRARPIAFAAAGLATAILLFLLSRPLWMVGHGSRSFPTLATIQPLAGQKVDLTRTYAEQAMNWTSWYYGWPLTILGLAGLVFILYHAIAKRDLIWMMFLAMVGVVALLYWWNPNNTPDQIWVMRRYVPLVLPGVVGAAALVLDRASSALWRRFRAVRWARWSIGAVTGICTLSLFAGFVGSYSPGTFAIERSPQLAATNFLCDSLPKNAAVLGMSKGTLRAVGTLRYFCRMPSVFLLKPEGQASTAERVPVARAAGHELWALMVSPPASDVPAYLVANVSILEPRVGGVPTGFAIGKNSPPFSIWLGKVADDGSIKWQTPDNKGTKYINPTIVASKGDKIHRMLFGD